MLAEPISLTLGILYALPTVGILYFAHWALEGILGSRVWRRNARRSIVPVVLSAIWFGVAVALCWACTWILVQAIGHSERLFGFVVDDRMFWVGVVAGIVWLGGGLYVRYRRRRKQV